MVNSGFNGGKIKREEAYLLDNLGKTIIVNEDSNSYLTGGIRVFGGAPGDPFYYFCEEKIYYFNAKFTEHEWQLHSLTTLRSGPLVLSYKVLSCLKQMLDINLTNSIPPRFQTPEIRIIGSDV